MSETKTKSPFTLPEGRLINESLFVLDTYVDPRGKKGEPNYKVEVALEDDDTLDAVIDKIVEAAVAEWGPDAEQWWDEGKIASPLKDGDKMAAKREAKGKQGDAYKGKVVIRANTKFNKHGTEGPGGIQVFDLDLTEIEPNNRNAIYPGCYVEAAVTAHAYNNSFDDDRPSVKFYLSAVQKTRDGEKLVAERDHSSLFTPKGRGSSSNGGSRDSGRRRRTE